MKPFLSTCLIVKNEEKVLRRCLESIKGIADEIIVVDTGSTDKTKEIAFEYTAMVYDYKWEDDFSKARNFAASKASGEWIFAIDADEYVDREGFSGFWDHLRKYPQNNNILIVQIVNFVGNNGKNTVLNYHERVYINDGSIKYYRNIHEMLKHKHSLEKRGITQLQIYHSGYMGDVVKEKNKSKRNLSLLRKKNEKEAIDYYFIGNEYFQLGDLDKAISYYKKGFQLKENIHSDWVKKLLVRLVDCLHALSRNKEAMEIIGGCEEVFSELVDFKFLKGKIYKNNGKIKEAINVFEEILIKKNKLIADSSVDYLEYLPHKYLGELYEKEKQYQLAVHHYSKALTINDSDDHIWMNLLNLLGEHSNKDELIQFINNKCLNRSSMTLLRLVRILLNVPISNVQKLTRSFLYTKSLSLEEEEAILLKNLFLDKKHDEILKIINDKTINEITLVLSIGIFNITDFILLALETKDEEYRNTLFSLKFDEPIHNLLNVLFVGKIKKISLFEEELLISIIKQAQILRLVNVVQYLNKILKKLEISSNGCVK